MLNGITWNPWIAIYNYINPIKSGLLPVKSVDAKAETCVKYPEKTQGWLTQNLLNSHVCRIFTIIRNVVANFFPSWCKRIYWEGGGKIHVHVLKNILQWTQIPQAGTFRLTSENIDKENALLLLASYSAHFIPLFPLKFASNLWRMVRVFFFHLSLCSQDHVLKRFFWLAAFECWKMSDW